jgi:hypothetical protein
MLFREMIAVYYKKHTENTDALCGKNIELLAGSVKASGTNSYHSDLKGNSLYETHC